MMRELMALDWESHQLCGVDAQVAKGRVRVRAGGVFAWPEGFDPQERPAEAGAWLKGELQRAGFTAREVAVSLPREDVVVRKLDLPNAPDDELPDLVRMQAATTSSTSLDRLLLDFLPLPAAGEAGRTVLMATISVAGAQRIRAVVEAAGLELVSIGISPAATAELAARAEQHVEALNAPSLVVARHGQRVEISVVRGTSLLFTHSTEVYGEDEPEDIQRVLAEISRSFMALQQHLAGGRVGRAWVLGGDAETATLREALAARLSCPVQVIDPLAIDEMAGDVASLSGAHSAYASPVGTLLAAVDGTVPAIDFLAPRRPPVKKDTRRQKMAIAAAGVFLIIAVGWGSVKVQQGNLEDSLERKRVEERELDTAIKEGAPLVASAQLIEEWAETNVPWLDQLQAFNALLPGTKDMYFTDLRTSPGTRGAVGRIQATGYARQQQTIYDFYQTLATHKYATSPPDIVRNSRDAEYPNRFELDVQIAEGAR